MNLNSENSITIYWKSIDTKRNRYNSRFEKTVYKALLQQIEPALSFISRQSSSLNPDDVADQISTNDIEKVITEIYTSVSPQFAKDSYSSLLPAKSYNPIVSTKAIDDLVTIWLDKFRNYVFNDGAEKVKNITNTSKTIIKRIIQKTGNEGLSIPDTAKSLLSEWKSLAKSRSVVIARTEVISASNYGSLVGAQSTGLDIDKIWISTRDSRTRDRHRSADNQRVDINSPFTVGGENLMAPGLGKIPSNNIQCRCAVGYKRKGEE